MYKFKSYKDYRKVCKVANMLEEMLMSYSFYDDGIYNAFIDIATDLDKILSDCEWD